IEVRLLVPADASLYSVPSNVRHGGLLLENIRLLKNRTSSAVRKLSMASALAREILRCGVGRPGQYFVSERILERPSDRGLARDENIHLFGDEVYGLVPVAEDGYLQCFQEIRRGVTIQGSVGVLTAGVDLRTRDWSSVDVSALARQATLVSISC